MDWVLGILLELRQKDEELEANLGPKFRARIQVRLKAMQAEVQEKKAQEKRILEEQILNELTLAEEQVKSIPPNPPLLAPLTADFCHPLVPVPAFLRHLTSF